MHEQLKVYVCHECGREFLFEENLQSHKQESGHRLFTSREIDEFPIPSEPDGETNLGNELNLSIATLQRVMNALVQKAPLSRTNLSQVANVHYSRLSKYLRILAYRHYIEYSMHEGKLAVKLTARGKIFADELMKLYIRK